MEDRSIALCKQLSELIRTNAITSKPDALPAATGLTEKNVSESASKSNTEVCDPSPYMVALVKDTLVLSRVLSKFLDNDALQDIMHKVIHIEETRLLAEYHKASGNAALQKFITTDKAHFIDKLSNVVPQVGRILMA